MQNVPEQELINTTCSGGRLIVTTRRLIIKEIKPLSQSAQTIPRESITGVDATIKVLSAELTFHRLGGNPLTVTKVPKDAAKAIVALLS